MKRFFAMIVLIASAMLWVAGCGAAKSSEKNGTVDGIDSDTDIDSDGDTDVDADGDSDSDSDGDTVFTECFQGAYEIHDIADMEALRPYSCIDGSLSIRGTSLTTIDLPNLIEISGMEGYLSIVDNVALKNLDGLSALTKVAGLGIGGNTALTNLDGLSALETVNGHDSGLSIEDNASLTNLDGLSALTDVGGSDCQGLSILNNDALTSIEGLGALSHLGCPLIISDNAALKRLDGLGAVTLLSRHDVDISRNAALTSLDGLNALTEVGSLKISGNTSLKNLDGLSALTEVGRYPHEDGTNNFVDLRIEGNAALTNLDGLSALTLVGGDLYFTGNKVLPYCETCDVLDRLVDFEGEITASSDKADSCWTGSALDCP